MLRHGSYLGPLGHLPLWTTGRALAGPPLHGPLQVGHGAEFTVDGAVQARRQHLPTPNLTKLETLPTGSRTLAPAAGLPPEHEQTRTSSTFHAVYFFLPVDSTWADILCRCRSRGPAQAGSEHHSTCHGPQRRHSEYR